MTPLSTRVALAAALAAFILAPLSPALAGDGNQVPVITHPKGEYWYPQVVETGFRYTVVACDPDGGVNAIVTGFEHHMSGGFMSSDPNAPGTPCAKSSWLWGPEYGDDLHPQVLTVQSCARDNSGEYGYAQTLLRVDALPRDPRDVANFPDLAALPAPLPGSRVHAEFVLSATHQVKAHRLLYDGVAVSEGSTGAAPAPGDYVYAVDLDRLRGTMSASFDGEVTWEALVTQDGTAWWHLVEMPHIDSLYFHAMDELGDRYFTLRPRCP